MKNARKEEKCWSDSFAVGLERVCVNNELVSDHVQHVLLSFGPRSVPSPSCFLAVCAENVSLNPKEGVSKQKWPTANCFPVQLFICLRLPLLID